MAQQTELATATPAAVTVLVDDWIRMVALWTEQLPRTKDCPAKILAYLRFTRDLFEIVHVHIVLLDDGLVPSGWDYPFFVF